MANEVEVRYLKDKEGNTFIPVAHADHIIGLPENLNNKLIKLEDDNYYLSNKVKRNRKHRKPRKGDDNVLS
ncbi:hypothetical protein ABLV98_00405 [Staphylococcus sp. 50Mo3-1]|uniref:hypothetical protein n=1 Tax=Staphylococcus sp. 50Mo3-2 TaxID=3135642 RepID=UPI003A814C31